MNDTVINDVGVSSIVPLTPVFGEMLLSRREHERTATKRHIMALAKSIKNAGWFGSVICVTESGELLDGQNRLLALRELGWPELKINIRTFKDDEATPEIRAAFNRSRPQSLRDTMKMCFGWEVNSSRLVPLYSALARICAGKIVVDEYLMLSINESFPDRLLPIVTGRHLGLSADVKCAFVVAGISDTDKVLALKDAVENMIFPTARCHARRIYDYIYGDRTKVSDLRKNRGHDVSLDRVLRVIYAIDRYLNNESCPNLFKVNDQTINSVSKPYIKAIKEIINFG